MSEPTDIEKMVQGDTSDADRPTQKEALKSDIIQKNGIDEVVKAKPVNGLSDHSEDSGDGEQDGDIKRSTPSASQAEENMEVMDDKQDEVTETRKVEQNTNIASPVNDTKAGMENDKNVQNDSKTINDSSKCEDDNKTEDKSESVEDNCKEEINDEKSESPADSKSEPNGKRRDKVISDANKISGDQKETADKDKSGKENENGLIETVKDGDGDEILITLNKDDDAMDCDLPVQSSKDTNKENNEKSASDKSDTVKPSTVPAKLPPPPPLAVAPNAANAAISSALKPNPSTNTLVNLPLTSLPPGAQFAQQGNKLGYITKVGFQTIFVPLNVSTIGGTAPASTTLINQMAKQQHQPQNKLVPSRPQPTAASALTIPAVTADDLKPKNSWEMMELMRWEVQNRVSDSWNWSVAFHPKKEELSSVTSFLLETGSDMVKEQVYKDIIQIQTKKKDAGELKDAEVESLGKMKTVYENTKKKVEHLQLKSLQCKMCDFKTESKLVMSHHKDYPHYDPPWDTNRGTMMCSLCNFRTKVHVQFIFHMQDVHSRQARLPDKVLGFQCSLCPLNATSKSKLEKHQGKCMKHFKLNINLQPYYHDVNFCMKQCYYKPKKPVVKPPPPPPAPKAVAPKPTLSMHTRQQGTISQPQLLPQAQRAPRPTAPTANVSKPAILQTRPTGHQQQGLAGGNIRLQMASAARQPKPPPKEMSGFEVCEMCGGYVKDRQALRIHFYYAHKVELPITIFQRPNPPLSCEVCKSQYWTMQGLTKHKTTMQHFQATPSKPKQAAAPVASQITNLGMQQCFMCTRKVGNLFIHFEQTHGVTMKDMVLMKKCIICGVTAADRRSLEVHLASIHGVRIKSTDYLIDKPAVPKQPISSGPKQGKNIGKINFCVFCEIQFADNIQLTMHCMKKHATCRTCGMVVKLASMLESHSCMKANRVCNICGLQNMTLDSYASHLKKHVKPCKVIVENLSEAQIQKAKDKVKREYKPAVISLDSDEDNSDVEVVETKPSKMKCVLEKDTKADESEPVSVDDDDDVQTDTAATTEKSSETDNKEPENGSKGPKSYLLEMEVDSDTKEKSADSNPIEISVDSDGEEKSVDNDNKPVEQSTANDIDKTEQENDESGNDKLDLQNVESLSEEATKKEQTESVKDSSVSDNGKNMEGEICEEERKNVEEGIDEEELLGIADETNDSTDSSKRKRSDSDIDEDELLRDESVSKKMKLDSADGPNDYNEPKDDLEKADENKAENITDS